MSDLGDVYGLIGPLLYIGVGALLTRMGKRSDVRDSMRIEAADLLADLDIGRTSIDDFTALRGRLRTRLRAAGVPSDLVTELTVAFFGAWHEKLHSSSDETPEDEASTQLFEVLRELTAEWLASDSSLARWRLRRGAHSEFKRFVESGGVAIAPGRAREATD